MPRITGMRGKALENRVFSVSYFRGLDLANPPQLIHKSRSAKGLNMVRDVPGRVRKRQGYERLRGYPGRINGIYPYRDELLVHAGGQLFRDGEVPEELGALADARSAAKLLDGKLWIVDGERFSRYDGESLTAVEDIAFLPTITISRAPEGGGVIYQAINLLNDSCKESFLGRADIKVYQLSREELAETPVKVRKQNSGGEWVELKEGVDFSVSRQRGVVTFIIAPGAPPVTGEDNVEIEYAAERPENRARINGCRFGICYGLGGTPNRLFLSGNDDYRNYDFHSEMNDPTYFGDEWYGTLGQAHSPIMGYSIIGDMLAAHKRNDDDGRNIILRKGSLEKEDMWNPDEQGLSVQFRICGVIQGAGATASRAFGFAREPIFLTALGVSAATPYVYNEERYVQNRGIYLNRVLLAEPNLADAVACVFRNFYILAVNGRAYVFDTLEQSAEKAERSDYQYEGYLFDNIPARVLENVGGRLYFGSESGSLMRFYDEPEQAGSYTDAADGEGEAAAIRARWSLEFSGQLFYKRKYIDYIAVRIAPYAETSVEIIADSDREQRVLMGNHLRIFMFSNLRFSGMQFSSRAVSLQTVGKRVRAKCSDAVRLTLRNDNAGEPFGLHEVALEYREGKEYVR